MFAVGVPFNWPVVALKVAQLGKFVTVNASVVPVGAVVTGKKVYWLPAVTVAGGVPEMVGGAAVTVTMVD